MYWWSVYEPFSVISQFRFQSHHGPIRSVFHRFGIIGARCPPAMATGDNSWHVGGEREKTPGKLRFCSLVLDGSSRLPTHCISHILCDERHAIWSSRALLPPRSSFYLQRLGHFLSSQNVELSGRTGTHLVCESRHFLVQCLCVDRFFNCKCHWCHCILFENDATVR